MTGIFASQAFFTAGTSASGSDGASTMAATLRLIAFSTNDTCPARSVSEAAPWNDDVNPLMSLTASAAPFLTFCQKSELTVLTITAISLSAAQPVAATSASADA